MLVVRVMVLVLVVVLVLVLVFSSHGRVMGGRTSFLSFNSLSNAFAVDGADARRKFRISV